MENTIQISWKERITQFVWQHLWLLVSLYIMTVGIALCVRSCLGSSVISSLPMSFAMAGEQGLVPGLTIGQYTYIMNFVLVVAQVAVLRRRFDPVQLFQLLVGFVFGAFIDVNMLLTSVLPIASLPSQIAAQVGGCVVLAAGISMEVRCGSITMPGEGIQVAVCYVTGAPFAKVKIMIDSLLVVLAVASCYLFWGRWEWSIIGPGTLFAMIFVGAMVRVFSRHLGWFDHLLGYRPGFRRYIYGLARWLQRHN